MEERIQNKLKRMWPGILSLSMLMPLLTSSLGITSNIPHAYAFTEYSLNSHDSCLALPLTGGTAIFDNEEGSQCIIPAGATLDLTAKSLAIAYPSWFVNFGDIVLADGGRIYNTIEFQNYGSIYVDSSSSIVNRAFMTFIGPVYNSGAIRNDCGAGIDYDNIIGNPAIQSCGINPDRIQTDFNGDGFEDLAIGVSAEDIGTNPIINAGAVSVIHGSKPGLSATRDGTSATGLDNQIWTQNSPFVNGAAQSGEFFGRTLAVGDFDANGYSDIAIGTPHDKVSTADASCADFEGCGSVNVVYGTHLGISPNTATIPDQIFHQNSPNIEDSAEYGDNYGSKLASGDFNNDGHDDLAIGIRLEDVEVVGIGIIEEAGAVNVIYGSSVGLSATGALDGSGQADQFWALNSEGIDGEPHISAQYGVELSIGDFNGDSYDDLAVNGNNIIYGSSYGLTATLIPDQLLPSQSTTSTTGDFNADGYDDLALGFAGSRAGASMTVGAGYVSVMYGSSTGLSTPLSPIPDQYWDQDVEGVEGTVSGINEYFGTSLNAGDFNADGYEDLAIGVSSDRIASLNSQDGSINVIYGSPVGLSVSFLPDQLFSQNSQLIEEQSGHHDQFGSTLTSGDYNNDGFSDLAVGVQSEDVYHDTIHSAGGVEIIYGSSTGLSAFSTADGTGRDDQLFTQNSPQMKDVAEFEDFMSSSSLA